MIQKLGISISLAAIGFCMLAIVCNVWGYPTGAPAPACAKLRPIHMNATAQTSPSPYKIVVTSDILKVISNGLLDHPLKVGYFMYR